MNSLDLSLEDHSSHHSDSTRSKSSSREAHSGVTLSSNSMNLIEEFPSQLAAIQPINQSKSFVNPKDRRILAPISENYKLTSQKEDFLMSKTESKSKINNFVDLSNEFKSNAPLKDLSVRSDTGGHKTPHVIDTSTSEIQSESENESSESKTFELTTNGNADYAIDPYFKAKEESSLHYKDKFNCEDLLYIADIALTEEEYDVADELYKSIFFGFSDDRPLETFRSWGISEAIQGRFRKSAIVLQIYWIRKSDDKEIRELWNLVEILNYLLPREVLESVPRWHDEQSLLALAATLCTHKLFKVAEDIYREILKKGVSYRTYREWGILLLIKGDFEAALKTLRIEHDNDLRSIFTMVLAGCISPELLRSQTIDHENDKDLCQILEVANTLRNRTKFRLAEDVYKEIMDIDPSFYSVYRDWGLCLLMQGKYEAALQIFGYALKIDPTDNEINLLSQTSTEINKIISAIVKRNREIIIDKQKLYTTANAFRGHSASHITKVLYTKLLKLDPNNPEIYRDYGIDFLLQRNKGTDALNMFQQGLEIDPHRAELYIMLAVANQKIVPVYEKRNKELLETIESYYLKALDLDPSSKVASVLLGNLLIHEHRYEEAVQAYMKGSPSILIQPFTTCDEEPTDRGAYQSDLDSFDETKSSISQDSDLNISFVSDINLLINLSSHDWDTTLGKSLCQAYFLWGKTLITQQGKFEQAMEKFEKILDLNSYYLSDVRFFLACISLLQNEFDKAVQHLAQVFRPDPNFEDKPGADKLEPEMKNMSRIKKAAYLRKKGFYKEAMEEYRAELKTSKDALVKWELGKLCLRAGQQEEASHLIREAFLSNKKIINSHTKGIKLPKAI